LAAGPEKRKAVIRVEAVFAIDCTKLALDYSIELAGFLKTTGFLSQPQQERMSSENRNTNKRIEYAFPRD
jgi:hypothetical protein